MSGHVDKFDLSRFLSAQDNVYIDVLEELRSGRKRTQNARATRETQGKKN